MNSLQRIHEIHIEVSDSCNLNCSYCYFASKNKVLTPFPINRFNDIIDRFFSQTTENVNIVFHGGEPLLLPAQWFEDSCSAVESLAEKHKKKIRFQLQTNGTLLTEQHISVFVKYKVIVSVSLDGPKTVHDNARGRYSECVSAIKALQDASIFGSVITVISKHNYNRIESIVTLLKLLSVTSYHFNIASIVNDAKELVLTPEEILEYYISSYFMFLQNYKEICDWILLGKLRRFVTGKIPLFHCDSPICGAGLYKIHILKDGTYYPCGSCVSNKESKTNFVLGDLMSSHQPDTEAFLTDFHSIYFANRKRCEQCASSVICDFFCPAFDKVDTVTAQNRCIATQDFYAFLIKQEKQRIEDIVYFYNTH